MVKSNSKIFRERNFQKQLHIKPIMTLSMELQMQVMKEEIHQMMSSEVMQQLIVQQMLMEDLVSDV